LNESFWVTTGTTSCGVLSEDVQLAAQSTATVVILMGMSRLAEIMLLFAAWRSENLPVAVIQQGTWEDEKIALGTVKDILDKVAEKGISSPAIIVLGDVVGLHPDAVKIIYHSVSNT
jgi:uroporphyrin-III C-methyltransferase